MLIRANTIVIKCELVWNTSEQRLLYTSAEDKRDKLQQQQLFTTVLFFCLSATSGTEGIKHVKNFVAFLALYRRIFWLESS